jgi:hypothetical protein
VERREGVETLQKSAHPKNNKREVAITLVLRPLTQHSRTAEQEQKQKQKQKQKAKAKAKANDKRQTTNGKRQNTKNNKDELTHSGGRIVPISPRVDRRRTFPSSSAGRS